MFFLFGLPWNISKPSVKISRDTEKTFEKLKSGLYPLVQCEKGLQIFIKSLRRNFQLNLHEALKQ